MCRSIKPLRRPGLSATSEEIEAAALQFVRKIGAFQKPSRANQAAVNLAVSEISAASRRLLKAISRPARPSHDSVSETNLSTATK